MDGSNQVVEVFTSDIFHANIINNKCEADGLYGVTLEGEYMHDGSVSVVWGKMFDQVVVFNEASLIYTWYGILYCNVNVSFVIKVATIVL